MDYIQLQNKTVTENNYDTLHIFQIFFLVVIFLFGLSLNLVVLVIYVFSINVRQVKNNLGVFNLIICDLIFVFIVIPMSFITITFPDSDLAVQIMKGPICQLTGFLSVTVCTTSSLTLACIAIDRYSAALHPLSYSTKIQQKHCIIILGFCWLWSMLTAIPPVLPNKPALYVYHDGTKHCSPSFRTHCWYFWYCIVMGFGIPLPVMTFCYVQIYRILRNQRRKVFGTTARLPRVAVIENPIPMKHINSFGMDSNPKINHHQSEIKVGENKFRKVANNLSRRPQVQIAKRGALLILAYFLCWGPYSTLFSCPGHIVTAEWVEVMAMWIVYSLVVWNPLIYVFNNHQFRLEMKRFLRRFKNLC